MHVDIYTYMQVYPRDMRVSPILWSKMDLKLMDIFGQAPRSFACQMFHHATLRIHETLPAHMTTLRRLWGSSTSGKLHARNIAAQASVIRALDPFPGRPKTHHHSSRHAACQVPIHLFDNARVRVAKMLASDTTYTGSALRCQAMAAYTCYDVRALHEEERGKPRRALA